MNRIDVSKIEGYAEMSVEDKLKALEAYEIPAADYSGYIKKDVFDKTASDLAQAKRDLKAHLTEDEAKRKDAEDAHAELQKKYEGLKRKTDISEMTAEFIKLGYDANLATATAEAFVDGDTATVFANQQKAQSAFEKKLRADMLKVTPKPDIGGESQAKESLGAKYAREFNSMYATNVSEE